MPISRSQRVTLPSSAQLNPVVRRRVLKTCRRLGAISRSVDWLRVGRLSGGAAAAIALWQWQWELVVATTVGLGVMGGIYLAYDFPWERYLEEFYRFCQGEYRRLVLSVGGGATAVCLSYGAIALWQSSENHWLTTAVGLQGLMIGAILILSVRQQWGNQGELQKFEAALENLGHQSTVKRLAAIRYLRQALQQHLLDPEQQRTLYTFLRLAWKQETETALRGALLSTLSLYQQTASKSPERRSPQPLPRPLRLEKSRPPVHFEAVSQTSPHPLNHLHSLQTEQQ